MFGAELCKALLRSRILEALLQSLLCAAGSKLNALIVSKQRYFHRHYQDAGCHMPSYQAHVWSNL